MPCDSSYMEASGIEVELSRAYQLLDELEGGTIDKRAWEGYDRRAYCHASREALDDAVEKLCTKLSQIKDVSKYSLELQLWWRDHQDADREKLRGEL